MKKMFRVYELRITVNIQTKLSENDALIQDEVINIISTVAII